MSLKKLIKRPTGEGQIITAQYENESFNQNVTLHQILFEKYPYILDAMVKEAVWDEYLGEDNIIPLFKEIVYDKKVVGFSVYKGFNYDPTFTTLSFIYVLPEYRGHNHLISDMNDTDKIIHYPVVLDKPNKYAIESLIKNNEAVKINEHLIYSNYLLAYTVETTSGEGTTEYYVNILSPFYDTNLCGVICLDLRLDNNTPHISSPTTVDVSEFDAMKNRAGFMSFEEYLAKSRKEVLNYFDKKENSYSESYIRYGLDKFVPKLEK